LCGTKVKNFAAKVFLFLKYRNRFREYFHKKNPNLNIKILTGVLLVTIELLIFLVLPLN
jgi:hypothetical protein